jgi:hypothetical protein
VKNISAWAIRHPITPIVLFVVLFFLGMVAFIRLPINLMPDISFPLVSVSISQPGASPVEMETQIAQKVEGSIASIGNVRNITTYIIEGTVTWSSRSARPSIARSRMCAMPWPRCATIYPRGSWSLWCSGSTSTATPSPTTR